MKLFDDLLQNTELSIVDLSLLIVFALLGFGFAYSFRDLVAVIVFITGIGFTIIPVAVASFYNKVTGRAATASFIAGIAYVFSLLVVATFQEEQVNFFKNNADLAILSIVVSAVVLVIFQVSKLSGVTPGRQSRVWLPVSVQSGVTPDCLI